MENKETYSALPIFTLAELPDGVYTAMVVSCVSNDYAGGKIIPPCPRSIITFDIVYNNNHYQIQDTLYRCQVHNCYSRIVYFLISCGLLKPGEKVSPDWENLIGLTCRCEIETTTQTYNGKTLRRQQIAKYLEPVDTNKTSGEAINDHDNVADNTFADIVESVFDDDELPF